MFYFRLNKVKILDNGDGKFLGLFGKDKSRVQFISLVVSSSVSLPNLEELIDETDSAKRATILKDTAASVAASVVFTPIDKITDNFDITFGDTGKIVYMEKAIPESFSWELLCMKLNKGNRDLGTELLGVVNDTKFDGLASNFPKLVGAAVSPAYTAGVEIGKFIFKAFATHMSKQKDKQLGILETSFIRQLDYPHGNREGKGVRDSRDNLRIDYSLLGFEG